MNAIELKEKVNYIMYLQFSENRELNSDEKDLCEQRIERLKNEIDWNNREIESINRALANER